MIPNTEDIVTICPSLRSIIAGRNALSVQKWARVFTPNVLCRRRCQLAKGGLSRLRYSLLNVVGSKVQDELSLSNSGVVNDDRRVADLKLGVSPQS